MSISTEMIINIGIILGITILTIILIRTVVIGALLKLTGKSKTTHDDAIVAALKKPFTLIPIGIALPISLKWLKLQMKIRRDEKLEQLQRNKQSANN